MIRGLGGWLRGGCGIVIRLTIYIGDEREHIVATVPIINYIIYMGIVSGVYCTMGLLKKLHLNNSPGGWKPRLGRMLADVQIDIIDIIKPCGSYSMSSSVA